jgi:hypothetical protein
VTSPIIVHAKAIYGNYAASIPLQHYFHTSWHWVNYGHAPCQIDNYIYCTYGIVMVAPLLALAGAVMAVVLWQIKVLNRPNRIAVAIRRGLA